MDEITKFRLELAAVMYEAVSERIYRRVLLPEDLTEDPNGEFVIINGEVREYQFLSEEKRQGLTRYKNNFVQNVSKKTLEQVDSLIEEATRGNK